MHDSDARSNPPKCDEDTRGEAIRAITEWVTDRDSSLRLLCMTGAAGSGKSALQQTIAEICGRNKTLGSSFFFSATDPSRNTLKAVVPTIAYQLGSANVVLKRWITIAVENDRLIFFRSLKTQMSALIVQPFKRLKQDLGLAANSLPHAILIDGLDECKGEERQAELLAVIKECFLESDLPFRVFIASRPEWAVRTALEPGGDLHGKVYHIQLSDDYDASEDIARYLRRRFSLCGRRIGTPGWFTEDDIQALVKAASGQFIYAATVINTGYLAGTATSRDSEGPVIHGN
ncbi:hypothetical protein MD484_g6720, partial [Candolleomyces efflorescens]